MFKRLTPNEDGSENDTDCRDLFTDCPPSRTADIVMEYARNNTRWHEDFGPAFQILLEHGYEDNYLVAAGETLPGVNIPMSTTDADNATAAAQSIKAVLAVLMVGAATASLFNY